MASKAHRKPELVPAETPDQWGEGLEGFRLRHKLSIRDLAGICGGSPKGMSKSTVARICRGIAEPRFIEKVKPGVLDSLRTYLSNQRVSKAQIEEELRTIFVEEEMKEMITQRSALPLEVQRYFGLRRDPFTGDPRSATEVFTTPKLNDIASQIEDAINYQGFLAVIGEIGSGKSLLKRRTMETVKNSSGKLKLFWPEFFNQEKVHAGSIVSFILHSFDQSAPRDLVQRAGKLKNLLSDLSKEGVRVALGFDECHHLHDDLLTALKNFWELGSGGYDRFLGVVLFGQPQFEGRLREHRFREIVERIEIARVPGLGKSAWDYVSHRIKTAGGDADRLFDRGAVSAITRLAESASPGSLCCPLALGNLANALLIKTHKLGEKKALADFVESNESGEPRVRAMRKAG
jgi:type II secretory pathway predicted ATPase ExeA